MPMVFFCLVLVLLFAFFLKLICSTYLLIIDFLVFQSGEDPKFFT